MTRPYYLDVPGAALTKNERELIVKLSSEFEGTPLFFGIGVMWGGSFHCMRAGNPNAEIYGLDIDYYTYRIHREDLIKAIFLKGNSTTYQFDKPIDFLFVDGAHDYNTVKADIANWKDRVKVDGIIAFHDFKPKQVDVDLFPSIVGVNKAVMESELTQVGKRFIQIEQVDSIIAFRRIE
ncbi:MAG: class I SAM-dependent methyltransferase [Candidatus Paceibacterota bacterium]